MARASRRGTTAAVRPDVDRAAGRPDVDRPDAALRADAGRDRDDADPNGARHPGVVRPGVVGHLRAAVHLRHAARRPDVACSPWRESEPAWKRGRRRRGRAVRAVAALRPRGVGPPEPPRVRAVRPAVAMPRRVRMLRRAEAVPRRARALRRGDAVPRRAREPRPVGVAPRRLRTIPRRIRPPWADDASRVRVASPPASSRPLSPLPSPPALRPASRICARPPARRNLWASAREVSSD